MGATRLVSNLPARPAGYLISRSHRAGDRDKGYPDSDPTVHASSRVDSRSSDRRYDRARNSRLDMVRIRTGGMRHPVPDTARDRSRQPLRQDATE